MKAKAAMMGITAEAAREAFLHDIPIGRFARPEEIAPLIAFLASARNTYIRAPPSPSTAARRAAPRS